MVVGTLKSDIQTQYTSYIEMRDNPPIDEDDVFEDWHSELFNRHKLLN
jgi:hypothetical protein